MATKRKPRVTAKSRGASRSRSPSKSKPKVPKSSPARKGQKAAVSKASKGAKKRPRGLSQSAKKPAKKPAPKKPVKKKPATKPRKAPSKPVKARKKPVRAKAPSPPPKPRKKPAKAPPKKPAKPARFRPFADAFKGVDERRKRQLLGGFAAAEKTKLRARKKAKAPPRPKGEKPPRARKGKEPVRKQPSEEDLIRANLQALCAVNAQWCVDSSTYKYRTGEIDGQARFEVEDPSDWNQFMFGIEDTAFEDLWWPDNTWFNFAFFFYADRSGAKTDYIKYRGMDLHETYPRRQNYLGQVIQAARNIMTNFHNSGHRIRFVVFRADVSEAQPQRRFIKENDDGDTD